MKFAIPHGNSGKKKKKQKIRREMHKFLTKLSRANGNFYSIDLVNIDPITPPRVFVGLYNGSKFYQDPNEN
jgi:hypothetical protein